MRVVREAFLQSASIPLLRRIPNSRSLRHASRNHRYRSLSSVSASAAISSSISSSKNTNVKKRIIFLGTPQVAADALSKLHASSSAVQSSSTFDICAVVTREPSIQGRKRQITPSPVHLRAQSLQIPQILTPHRASDSAFLSHLRHLSPDLCITAAYGHILPQSFLDIPLHGTLNIHPSLLPAWRGAAPVPRALEAGVKETGVSLAFTVLALDAGPVVASRRRVLSGTEKGSLLLSELFDAGVEELLHVLPKIWDGSARKEAKEQTGEVSHANKLSKEEARLTFVENAHRVVRKIHAFDAWPGTYGEFVIEGMSDVQRLKIIDAQVVRAQGGMCLGVHDVTFDTHQGLLLVTCDDGSVVGVSKVQPAGKKCMNAVDFWNGLRGRSLGRRRVPH